MVEPPARLLAFDPADWLPLVDPSGYDPEMYRNRLPGRPVGPVRLSFEDGCRQEAETLWTRARLDWCREFGWPGGLDVVQLLQQQVQQRRVTARERFW